MTGIENGFDERYRAPALERGLGVLEAFGADRQSLSLAELARAIGLSRSSAFRLVMTLVDLGYLERESETKKYRLGSRVLRLGYAYLASIELVELARPELEQLRDLTGCSAHLALLEGTEIIYVLRIPDRKALTSRIQVGSRLPAHATSIGRAILSQFPEYEVRHRFAGASLERFSDITPTNLDGLVTLLTRDRERGFIVSRSAFEPGIASVAAPLFDESGPIPAAINITTPEATLDGDVLETSIKDAVLHSSNAISAWLGGRNARRTA